MTDFAIFATMQNPIIDRQEYEGTAFSAEEASFVTQHIFENLPGEARGISLLLSVGSKGSPRPSDFDAVLKSAFDYNDTVTTTVRVGLVGRMAELGMLGREHAGVEVNYHLQKYGEDVLRRFSGHYLKSEAR